MKLYILRIVLIEIPLQRVIFYVRSDLVQFLLVSYNVIIVTSLPKPLLEPGPIQFPDTQYVFIGGY